MSLRNSDNTAILKRIGFIAIMDQITLSEAKYQYKKGKTHREIFL